MDSRRQQTSWWFVCSGIEPEASRMRSGSGSAKVSGCLGCLINFTSSRHLLFVIQQDPFNNQEQRIQFSFRRDAVSSSIMCITSFIILKPDVLNVRESFRVVKSIRMFTVYNSKCLYCYQGLSPCVSLLWLSFRHTKISEVLRSVPTINLC